ncbi:MAG: hypothetical protein IIB44_01985 [Candidatus Marinimicrobia bacterium]|nr:hypothetical protein [Candidatus Neomarinimicrobiota bacterium]
MVNLIPHDIRNLFPAMEVLPSPEELIDRIQINQYLEKTEIVYRLNLISEKSAIDDVSHILKLEDPNLLGIAWACLGGIYTFNGNYRKAFAAFNIALDQDVTDDVMSYTYMEISNLLRKLGYTKESISVLESALTMTKNDLLIWRIKTCIGLCFKFDDPTHSLALLNKSAEHYKKTHDEVRLGRVHRHIGEIYINLKDYKSANICYDKALAVSIEKSLPQYRFEVLNDKGWMLIQKGEYDKARSLFIEQIQKDLSPYLLSLALQNLGFLEYECGNYREAISYHSQSLQLTTRYEMRDMAFEDYYKLGLCYEKLGEMGLADHFYGQGYLELQKELDLGLRLMGYRRKLMDAYVEFLRNNQRIPQVNIKDKVFGFTMDLSLKDIRNLFHNVLLSLHLERTRNAPQMCKKLGIEPRTYFLYQKKLGLKRGLVLEGLHDNPYFKQYIESLVPLTWREANKKFEDDLFSFLLVKYQHNKKEMAAVLGVSYAQVVQKTKLASQL